MGTLELELLKTDPPVFALREETDSTRFTPVERQPVSATELAIVSPPEKINDPANLIPFPGLSKRRWGRVQKFHGHLHSGKFDKFFRPVSLVQVETAMEFLDQHYGIWDHDDDLAVWEYLLPAIHKVFPEHRSYGFIASFGPPKPAKVNWRFPVLLILSTALILLGLSGLLFLLEK